MAVFRHQQPREFAFQALAPETEQQKEKAPALEMDPVLLDIFSKETTSHLAVISDYIEACQGHNPPFHVTDKLHRACHTLHGSANMANVERGVAVAGALNRFVRRVFDYNVGFQKSGIDALRASGKAIATIIADINNPGQSRTDFAVLIEHLNKLTNVIETPRAKVVEEAPQEVEIEAEVETEDPAEANYDAEIAAIFSEEAAELLESADQALVNWSRNRDAREPVEELKRHLHTLKGGAQYQTDGNGRGCDQGRSGQGQGRARYIRSYGYE